MIGALGSCPRSKHGPISPQALAISTDIATIRIKSQGRSPGSLASVIEALHQWLVQQRQRVPDGSATAKAIDYSLNQWQALTRYVDDGALPADNNCVENQIRPIALGRSNWLFAGSLRAGKAAAAIMSLVHSARLNGHDPYAYLKDVLEKLPTQPAGRIGQLLPHKWQASATAT